MNEQQKQLIEQAWENRDLLKDKTVQDTIRQVVDLLDCGQLRIAEKIIRTAESCGISKKDIVIDPLCMTVSAAPNAANETLEAVILPGGMPGTTNLEASDVVQKALDFAKANDKYLCAICAAPSVLGHKGFLDGKEATAFPGFEKDLLGAKLSDSFVAVDCKCITARGAGAAVDFGLAIVAALKDRQTAETIRKSIQCPC